ncbi:NUDIX hydrolase [Clostridium mediterraneense]|uniref:NUDIX hydrolase n=1 Tax=Clostridium mediterraneense TaxID=1805472 RepID=UPI0008300DEE|nr:NUDIX hydrolase [Clostridium mediterraneense]
MINFSENGVIFNLRVAGIIIEDGYIFLERKEKDDFWSIPGGRVEFMEKTEDTIIREYKEEIDADIKVLRQLWIAEDFFKYENNQYHEIGFYYLVELLSKQFRDKEREYIGKEGKEDLIYKWFKLSEIEKTNIYPVFLKTGLKNIPKNIEKIIQE